MLKLIIFTRHKNGLSRGASGVADYLANQMQERDWALRPDLMIVMLVSTFLRESPAMVEAYMPQIQFDGLVQWIHGQVAHVVVHPHMPGVRMNWVTG